MRAPRPQSRQLGSWVVRRDPAGPKTWRVFFGRAEVFSGTQEACEAYVLAKYPKLERKSL